MRGLQIHVRSSELITPGDPQKRTPSPGFSAIIRHSASPRPNMGPGQRPASKRPWTWPPEVARVHHLALLCGLFRGGSSTDWDPCGLLPRPCGLASPCLLGASGGRWQVRTNHRAASAEDGGCSRFRLRFRHKGSRNPYWGHSREKVAPGKAALTGLYENGQPRPRYAQACVFPPLAAHCHPKTPGGSQHW